MYQMSVIATCFNVLIGFKWDDEINTQHTFLFKIFISYPWDKQKTITIVCRKCHFCTPPHIRAYVCTIWRVKIHGLMQKRRNSSALALELRLFWFKPSKWYHNETHHFAAMDSWQTRISPMHRYWRCHSLSSSPSHKSEASFINSYVIALNFEKKKSLDFVFCNMVE